MIFTQNIHPTRLFGPTCLIGTWEYSIIRARLHDYSGQQSTLFSLVILLILWEANFFDLSWEFNKNVQKTKELNFFFAENLSGLK